MQLKKFFAFRLHSTKYDDAYTKQKKSKQLQKYNQISFLKLQSESRLPHDKVFHLLCCFRCFHFILMNGLDKLTIIRYIADTDTYVAINATIRTQIKEMNNIKR